MFFLVACHSGNCVGQEAAKPVVPNWGEITLHVGDRIVKPVRHREYWPQELKLGDRLIQIEMAEVRALSDALDVVWAHSASQSATLHLLASNDEVLFFCEDFDRSENSPPPVLKRIDVETGKWLEDIPIPMSDDEEAGNSFIAQASLIQNELFCLSITQMAEDPFATTHYRVTKLSNQVDWSKSFESGGAASRSGGISAGELGREEIQGFTLVDNKLLVCGGPQEDLILLDRRRGEIEWQIERIWEYRRGVEGRIFMGRYGVEDSNVDAAKLSIEELRKKNEEAGCYIDEKYFKQIQRQVKRARKRVENETCGIFAGPVVVKDKEDGQQIFIVTFQNRGGYFSDCVAYEISQYGRVVATLTLPKFVGVKAFDVKEGSVVWKTASGDKVELFTTSRMFGDCLIEMNWQRAEQVAYNRKEAWLVQGRGDVPRMVVGTRQLAIIHGGYIRDANDRVMRYPIQLLDLDGDFIQELELHLPFDGRAPVPSTNFSNFSKSQKGWTTSSDYLMLMKEFEVTDGRLLVKFEYSNEHVCVEFDLDSVLR